MVLYVNDWILLVTTGEAAEFGSLSELTLCSMVGDVPNIVTIDLKVHTP